MTKQLHILTRPTDTLATEVIAAQQNRVADLEVIVVDLTQGPPDYSALLEQIFAADSVAVW
jgi:hypothetical protein